ncbi:MAG: GDSL-type esterase/lipase family protein [Verrucomicrobiota bacterium]
MTTDKGKRGVLRKKALVCAVALGVFAALLLVAEGAARLFCPHINSQGTQRSLLREGAFGETIGWQPNGRGLAFGETVEIDERGFRRLNSPAQSDEAWLLLGDSVTFGVGVPVEQTFAGRLQAAHPRVRIWNTAVIGYSIEDYAAVLADFQRRKEPIAKVILFLCLNDGYRRMTLTDNATPLLRCTRWLGERSKFYLLIKDAFFDRSHSYFEFIEPHYHTGAPEWARLKSGLEEIKHRCRESGWDLRVVVLPYEYQVRRHDTNLLGPQTVLGQLLETNAVATLDVTPAFAAQGREKRPLFLHADAMHLSSAGHELVFGKVEKWLGEPGKQSKGE